MMLNSLDAATISHHGLGKASLTGISRADCRLFARAYSSGQRRALWCKLRRQQNCLKDLAQVDTSARQKPPRALVSVSLEKITGSEGRVNDFDKAFNPLTMHDRDRWLRIAAARRRAKDLPPVDLIQVGGEYYVRDGHHRISVARAAGQKEIEARILYIVAN